MSFLRNLFGAKSAPPQPPADTPSHEFFHLLQHAHNGEIPTRVLRPLDGPHPTPPY